jgi:CBS domain-containing protein
MVCAMMVCLRDIMTSPVITMRDNARVSEAASAMCAHNMGSLIVVDRGEKPIGIVTERDILRKVVVPCRDPRAVEVARVMSRPLVTWSPDMDVEAAASLMFGREIKRLPIVDGGRLVEIVSFTDLLRAHSQIVAAVERSIGLDKLPRRFQKLMRQRYR